MIIIKNVHYAYNRMLYYSDIPYINMFQKGDNISTKSLKTLKYTINERLI